MTAQTTKKSKAEYVAVLNAKPVQRDGEPYMHFGTRLLTYLMAHDEFLLGVFDIDALECAHYAAHAALARTINLGDKDNKDLSPACVYDRLEALRRQVSESLNQRRAAVEATLMALNDGVPTKGVPGTGVLVSDIIPKPKLPPTGAYANIEMATVADPF